MSVDLTSQNRLAYPLLATRFFLPPLPVGCVPRPRLMERLNLGLHVPLTLISAPPGFGKSALIRQWIHHHTVDDQQNLTAGWLSLEPSDTDFGFFSVSGSGLAAYFPAGWGNGSGRMEGKCFHTKGNPARPAA